MKLASRSNRKIKAAFAFALVALLTVGGIAYRDRQASVESSIWVDHTYRVLESLQDLQATMERVESSYRTFAWTGQDSYLDTYRASVVLFDQKLTAVRSLTADNANQQRLIPELAALSVLKIQRAETLIGIRRAGGLSAVADWVAAEPDPGVTQRFRAIVADMQSGESRMLAPRAAEAERDHDQSNIILILGTLLSLGVAGFASWSVLRDNAGRALEQQALQESEERYHMLLDGLQDYAIFVLDPKGRVSSWNAGAARITGYTAQQIMGRDFSCFFPPDQVEQGRPAKVLGIAAEKGRYEEQGLRVRRDGSKFMATVTLTALRDSAGKLRGFSDISRDLSESKESEARYRGLLEAAPDAMVVVDQSGEIVLLNVQAENQFGYRRDELVGQPVKNIIPEGFAERLIADGTRSAAEALAQQIGTGIELTGRRKDGSGFPIEIMLSPLESAEGILVTAAIRDISVRKAAERHLAQMESRYRGLLEAAPDAMVVVNQSGEIVLLNVQAENQFGYRRDELVGQEVKNIIPEGFAERLIADGTRSAAEALAQQIGTGIELTGRRKDGSGFPIEIMLSPLESAEGILVTAAIRDISVRKAAERHLAQMESRYRGLLEAAPDAMVVVNQRGEIVLLNKQAESQFGYRRDELVGQEVKNIIPEGFAERLVADALRSTEDALAQQIGAGIELVGRRKNGSAFPIEIMLSPLESAEGILVTAAIRDITTRKNDQMQLRRTMEMLQQIIESSPVAIVNLDSDSRIVTWNRRAEEIFGYSAREAIGRSYVDLVGKSDADSLGELREVLTGRMVRSVEIERKRKDGSTVVLSVAAAALTDHGKSPVGIVALFEDITLAKETRSQLQHVQKMEAVGQLSGGIAHDFNNLLSVIIGNLDSLLIRLTSEKEREITKNALKGALRCAELTKQMLAFARRQELDPVQIDAGAMLRNLSVMLERMLGEMVQVETSTPADLWPCVADEDQVESALLNLAVNARDAMPGGGTLTIDASNARLEASYAARNSEVLAGDYVKFSVSDTGTGMSPELRARSMEPFFTTKDPGKGTGLGLSMVHGFAKQSGGHVKIYSELGFGTTVNLFLPRAESALSAPSEGEDDTATVSQGHETILVVDDNIEVRATACMQLTELGYRVVEAGDGKSALEILGNASTIDLVFSDVVMPGGMTGFDLARIVYRDYPEIKVLLVTGFAGAVLRQHVEVGESMPMLRKPYRRDELAARVRQALDAKRTIAEAVPTAMSGGAR